MPTENPDTAENTSRRSQRSEMVQEIVSNKPGFLVRYGIVFFLLTIILLISICWFIQYPDIVTTQAKLTSLNAPKEVKTKTDGKLIKLIATEGRFVQKGQLLGFMESRADHNQVIMLATTIDTLQKLVDLNELEGIPKYLAQPFLNLGEAQQSYQTFMQSFILFKQYLSAGYFLQKKGMLQNDIGYLQKLHANLLQQITMQQEDVGLAQKNLDANKSLNDDKVISAFDYRNEKSKYISKALTVPQIEAAVISNESSQHDKQKEIFQLENDIAQQKGIFSQALNTLKAQLDDWKSKYLLIAPIDGKVAFATFLQENQQLRNDQTICFINPENTEYYAEVYIPQANLGKVKNGQEVLLKFPAYPFQEYGSVYGVVAFITNIPTDSGYLAKVDLPAGLQTSYKKSIQFREGLEAQGEIITRNMRLLQRFYYSIVKQVK